MHGGVALPLKHRRVYSSRDPEQTRAFMASKEFGLELAPREAKTFDFIANIAYMPGTYLGYIQYGAAVTIHVPDVRARDDYWLHLPLRGACEITNNAGSAVCSPGRAVVSSPVGHFTRSEAGSARLTLSMTRATMVNQLAALLGDAPDRNLEFSPTMDLHSGGGQRFTRLVQLVVADLDEPKETLRSPIFLSLYEQLILSSILLSQPHSYTERLQRLGTRIAPGNVKRAVDFIEAHLQLSITLADITKASGVPGRTLLQHFKDHRGVSPMGYLRNARFARVREALMRAEEDESVTQIATAWGFYHLGRFSVGYRKRFGETPSQTRRRRRSRSARR
jgi:AraC-like DNA-binding protein